ncbi:multiple epidermal growth factor-like domains protein 6 [Saccostrea echinata]|uniref:multiple epidermal growth factor-like domains protein 6 n=1 Tax=Saccostrea echinata TaxID=191078 RepID=UPI002A8068AB|nr:multiple epidermal growth factor-like domains protein 6 [Saccostrea echinata]
MDDASKQLVVPYVTTAASSSVFQNYLPSRTVDGDTSQDIVSCSHTGIDATIREAWLRVDLGHVYSLNDVRFWYRNDRGSTALNTIRLRGYSIKISNSTNLSHAQTCYSDPGNQVLPTVLTNDCRGTSRFVWFYTTNVLYSGDTVPMLEICEVQIFGCQTGFYGENCSLTCDHCMNPSSCDIDSGECDISGCAHAGLQPPTCTTCAPGMFGGNCTGICSVHCHPPASCGFKDGNCTCEQGWKGSKCDTPGKQIFLIYET